MMKPDSKPQHARGFRFGWWILFIVSILIALSHFILIFSEREKVLYLGWTALGLFSMVILALPFRRAERWAWLATWILVAAMAVPVWFGVGIGPYYLGGAALLLIGMLLTAPGFGRK